MERVAMFIMYWLVFTYNVAVLEANVTYSPSSRQLLDYKLQNQQITLLTTSAGDPVDVRDTITLNTNILSNQYILDLSLHINRERIPERIVHAKGAGAFGYFEVTHDVSKYTKADVFNGIGKRTDLVARFSLVVQGSGGNDASRETKGLAIKFYTKEGNFDLIGLHIPVYLYRDPLYFTSFAHAVKKNPRTNLFDLTSTWDFMTLRPSTIHGALWLMSDYGIPNGYRKMDAFPIHTYEIYNKQGEKYYVKFNFRTEQGLQNLTTAQAAAIQDLDYFVRDLYNSIENKKYPSWTLEMDVMSSHDIQHIDYNPFEVTRLWKRGTYHTVTIGRLVLNKNPVNFFRDIEQLAYNPANLVPGISGPVDLMFQARRLTYRDAQNYRLGINHNKITVNTPRYYKTYNRDGFGPVRDNMNDAPNYYPNSYNGPIPFAEASRPIKRLEVLETNAVDLEPASYFYNYIVKEDAHKQRLAENLATGIGSTTPPVLKRALRLVTLVDPDLGRRVRRAIRVFQAEMQQNIEH